MKLEQNGYSNLFGIDASADAVSQVKNEVNTAQLHCLDVETNSLPFEDSSVDVVVCMEVFEHLYDPLAVLDEISRVLESHGLAIFSFPNEYRIRQRLKFMLGQSISSPFRVGGHIKLFNKDTAIQFVTKKLGVLEVRAVGDEKIRKLPALLALLPNLFAKWFFIVARKPK